MSVNAHKIIEMRWQLFHSFSLTDDDEIALLLGDVIYPQVNDDGEGFFRLGRSHLKTALAKATEEDAKRILGKLLREMEAEDQESVAFMAF